MKTKYKKGMTLLVAIATTSLLMLVSFFVANVALKQLSLSYTSEESQYAFYNSDSGTECALYWDIKNPSGTSAFAPYTPNDVSWQNPVGVNTSSNNLLKTAGSGWGNAGAASTQSINSGEGYIEFTASETNKDRVGGLAHSDVDQNYTSINFAWELNASGQAIVLENGSSRFTTTYISGDFFRVGVEGSVVKYYKNGILMYTNNSPSISYPLIFDSALNTTSSTITNVIMGLPGTSSTISCNNQSITSGQSVPTSPSATVSLVGGGGSANATSTFYVTYPKGCAIIKVGKYPSGFTRIESYGYNTCSTNAMRRYERGITLTYTN